MVVIAVVARIVQKFDVKSKRAAIKSVFTNRSIKIHELGEKW